MPRKRNPGGSWLIIIGGLALTGGAWWYLTRKKEKSKNGASNVHVVSTRSAAEQIAAKTAQGKIITVWMRNTSGETEVLAYVKQKAAQHKDTQFYFFAEPTFGHLFSAQTGVVVGSSQDGMRRFVGKHGLSDKVVDAKDGIDRALEIFQKGGGTTGATPTIGDTAALPE